MPFIGWDFTVGSDSKESACNARDALMPEMLDLYSFDFPNVYYYF